MNGEVGVKFGLLGEKLGHSVSPQIHAELGDYEYLLYEKAPCEVEGFLRSGEFDGLNVTIPYKQAVMPFCAELSETARLVGSVNTIIRRADGTLFGDNTDFYGIGYLLDKVVLEGRRGRRPVHFGGGKTVVLGSGGSSLAVQAALRGGGAVDVVVVSRTGDNNYENIDRHRDALHLINTTPVGMYPNTGTSPIADLGVFQNLRAVVDIVANPAITELMFQAEERGIAAYGGLTMLVAQAKRAAELFLSTEISDEKIDEIAGKVERQTKNIVLVGMPGCGKSTVGKALARLMGRKFVDSDELIVEAAGKPILEIFAEDGEAAFRALESQVLQDICKQSGLVIATGGGIVTRRENFNVMRQNSTVVFVDREISELAVEGRPLSQNGGIEALAAVRLPIYKQLADFVVKNVGVEETAEEIYRLILEVR